MVKLKGRHSFARPLALLARGLTVEEAAAELRRRYHPTVDLEKVKKVYFPPSPIPIAQMEGKSKGEILETLRKLKLLTESARQRMRQLNQNPEFREANVERSRRTMERLNSDPEFAKASAARGRRTLLELHKNPDFARVHAERASERMKRLHQDPIFAKATAEYARQTQARIGKNPKLAEARAERGRLAMKKLQAKPGFAEALAERQRKRMTQLNRDPAFQAKILAGIARFWGAYRASKQSALEEMGYDQAGFERQGGNEVRRIAVESATPEDLTVANEQHHAISTALSAFPLLHQTVVASHFDLDHPVPHEQIEAAQSLSQKQRKEILKNALTALRTNPTLKKISKS